MLRGFFGNLIFANFFHYCSNVVRKSSLLPEPFAIRDPKCRPPCFGKADDALTPADEVDGDTNGGSRFESCRELQSYLKQFCTKLEPCMHMDLIPKWRPISYSFVCTFISPCCLIFTSKLFCFLYMLTRQRGPINMQTKE